MAHQRIRLLWLPIGQCKACPGRPHPQPQRDQFHRLIQPMTVTPCMTPVKGLDGCGRILPGQAQGIGLPPVAQVHRYPLLARRQPDAFSGERRGRLLPQAIQFRPHAAGHPGLVIEAEHEGA